MVLEDLSSRDVVALSPEFESKASMQNLYRISTSKLGPLTLSMMSAYTRSTQWDLAESNPSQRYTGTFTTISLSLERSPGSYGKRGRVKTCVYRRPRGDGTSDAARSSRATDQDQAANQG
jgi:hypothetical protein